eukprot:CAMPEP_0204910564 /NCGR_PEP_ID=MMETSP1397-20131031/9064_1 /ASSEMBLY_ACC=CAM_ASM_000891 /TAXON_ID=49980 /ORGANISM="Climacostomum Climacostomum virens, Strain Stock W-24" /LENGTH=168 /DNA_ID=CAMNT_0052080773 /DNA_START=62 /DNA_END=568 /DNA_ORIENTATION=+
MDVDFFKVIIDENDTYKANKTMTIDLSSSKLITTYGIDPVWSTGSKTPPPQNTRNYDGCPFPEEERHDFEEGKQSMVHLACFNISLAVFSTLFACTKYKSAKLRPLREKQEVSYQDYMAFLILASETYQYKTFSPVLPGDKAYDFFYASNIGLSYLNRLTFVIIGVFT